MPKWPSRRSAKGQAIYWKHLKNATGIFLSTSAYTAAQKSKVLLFCVREYRQFHIYIKGGSRDEKDKQILCCFDIYGDGSSLTRSVVSFRS